MEDGVFKAPKIIQNLHLATNLRKAPGGWGFSFCLAEKNKRKKAPPPGGFSRDTAVLQHFHFHLTVFAPMANPIRPELLYVAIVAHTLKLLRKLLVILALTL